jgi:pre-mRNA-splicing factor 18
VLGRLAEIVHFMQKREYQKANDSYLRLSIGNAPWPIGVTMVGYVIQILSSHFLDLTNMCLRIHERSAREKISTDQVAHVLNDEVSRKYIQSLKRCVLVCRMGTLVLTPVCRLLTFAQTKYPPDDISQLMG